MTKSENPKRTDVRFSVHGSPFYKPVKLNGIMLRHREDFESELDINITMVGIGKFNLKYGFAMVENTSDEN